MIIAREIIGQYLLSSMILLLSFPAFADIVVWDGGGDGTSWSDPLNWNPDGVPVNEDTISIDCLCTVTVNSDLEIDGSLTVESGATIDMGGQKLEVGKSDNNAFLNNSGTITNSNDIKVKGDGISGEGPFITNSGIITSEKFSVGNNNGGGILTNTTTGIITVTDLGGDAMHVDGTICNEGTITVLNEVLFHGAVLTCGGIFNAAVIKLEDNPQNGGGASGGGSDIQSQSFTDGAGCSGATSSTPIYEVSGGAGGGPNGDDTYTYQQLLDEFGTIDTNPDPQFTIDPLFVNSCGETFDNIPPTITNLPNDTTTFLTVGDCNLAVVWDLPIITDNYGVKSITSSHNPGDTFPTGITLVTYIAEDSAGNTNSMSFNITVNDTISPVINNLPADIVQNADAGACGAIVSWTLPTASDNCSASLSSNHNPGDFFPVGTTTVTYTATDGSGNTDEQSFDITITDNINPSISGIPADISQNADAGECGAIVNWTLPTASDNCSASLSSSHNPGDFFNLGTTTVTYTALDFHGNSTTLSFDVILEENDDPPVFSFCPSISTIISVDTITKTSVITWDIPVVEDVCSGITLTSNYNPGDEFHYGSTTVVYTATDQSGNMSQCIFDVRTGLNIPPRAENQTAKANQSESIPIVLIVMDPDGDQVFIESISNNENNGEISNIDWENMRFSYTSYEDFYGYDTLHIELIDNGVPAAKASVLVVIDVERVAKIEIGSAITPNGDQINDTWYIKDIDLYQNNSISIFDRWGGLVYQISGYNNDSMVWDGSSNRGGKKQLPTGTYFYVINLGTGINKITGAVELVR